MGGIASIAQSARSYLQMKARGLSHAEIIHLKAIDVATAKHEHAMRMCLTEYAYDIKDSRLYSSSYKTYFDDLLNPPEDRRTVDYKAMPKHAIDNLSEAQSLITNGKVSQLVILSPSSDYKAEGSTKGQAYFMKRVGDRVLVTCLDLSEDSVITKDSDSYAFSSRMTEEARLIFGIDTKTSLTNDNKNGGGVFEVKEQISVTRQDVVDKLLLLGRHELARSYEAAIFVGDGVPPEQYVAKLIEIEEAKLYEHIKNRNIDFLSNPETALDVALTLAETELQAIRSAAKVGIVDVTQITDAHSKAHIENLNLESIRSQFKDAYVFATKNRDVSESITSIKDPIRSLTSLDRISNYSDAISNNFRILPMQPLCLRVAVDEGRAKQDLFYRFLKEKELEVRNTQHKDLISKINLATNYSLHSAFYLQTSTTLTPPLKGIYPQSVDHKIQAFNKVIEGSKKERNESIQQVSSLSKQFEHPSSERRVSNNSSFNVSIHGQNAISGESNRIQRKSSIYSDNQLRAVKDSSRYISKDIKLPLSPKKISERDVPASITLSRQSSLNQPSELLRSISKIRIDNLSVVKARHLLRIIIQLGQRIDNLRATSGKFGYNKNLQLLKLLKIIQLNLESKFGKSLDSKLTLQLWFKRVMLVFSKHMEREIVQVKQSLRLQRKLLRSLQLKLSSEQRQMLKRQESIMLRRLKLLERISLKFKTIQSLVNILTAKERVLAGRLQLLQKKLAKLEILKSTAKNRKQLKVYETRKNNIERRIERLKATLSLIRSQRAILLRRLGSLNRLLNANHSERVLRLKRTMQLRRLAIANNPYLRQIMLIRRQLFATRSVLHDGIKILKKDSLKQLDLQLKKKIIRHLEAMLVLLKGSNGSSESSRLKRFFELLEIIREGQQLSLEVLEEYLDILDFELIENTVMISKSRRRKRGALRGKKIHNKIAHGVQIHFQDRKISSTQPRASRELSGNNAAFYRQVINIKTGKEIGATGNNVTGSLDVIQVKESEDADEPTVLELKIA